MNKEENVKCVILRTNCRHGQIGCVDALLENGGGVLCWNICWGSLQYCWKLFGLQISCSFIDSGGDFIRFLIRFGDTSLSI